MNVTMPKYRSLVSVLSRRLISCCRLLSMGWGRHFKLTKFVNGYFSQGGPYYVNELARFLRFQPNLETLELHSGRMAFPKSQSILSLFYHLKTLGCPPQFLDTGYSLTRLRLNFEKKTDVSDNFEMRLLGRVLGEESHQKHEELGLVFKAERISFPGNHTRCRCQPYLHSASWDPPIRPYSGTSLIKLKYQRY